MQIPLPKTVAEAIYFEHGNVRDAARAAGVAVGTFRKWLGTAPKTRNDANIVIKERPPQKPIKDVVIEMDSPKGDLVADMFDDSIGTRQRCVEKAFSAIVRMETAILEADQGLEEMSESNKMHVFDRKIALLGKIGDLSVKIADHIVKAARVQAQRENNLLIAKSISPEWQGIFKASDAFIESKDSDATDPE